MRVLIVFTGGTIGSMVGTDGKIATEEASKYLLISEYEKKYGKKAEFDTIEPYRILSENLKAENMTALIAALQDALKKAKYDGVIITHGTDTLQYTAATLQYVFGGLDIPMLLVSSDYVLTDPKANGLVNFAVAMSFIEGKYGNGVFVSYRNMGDIPKIHRGNRLQNGLAFSADVTSICGGEYGSFVEGKFIKNEKYTISGENVGAMFENIELGGESVDSASDGSDAGVKLVDNGAVLRLRAYPGMQYPENVSGVKAVLYESYHSGTICIDEQLKTFAQSMKKAGIPVYVTGLDASEAEYETVEMFRQLGLVTIPNRAPISQYIKLWLACSNDLDVEKIMAMSCGEEC